MKNEIDIMKRWMRSESDFTEAMILSAIKDGIEEGKKQQVKKLIPEFEKNLEIEAELITESVADVIIIARLNREDVARELIRKQFVVIGRQYINEE